MTVSIGAPSNAPPCGSQAIQARCHHPQTLPLQRAKWPMLLLNSPPPDHRWNRPTIAATAAISVIDKFFACAALCLVFATRPDGPRRRR